MLDVSALVRSFVTAAAALQTGLKDSGYTGNGLRKLDFKVGNDTFTAIEQNPEKSSVPAMLARQGHDIVQIKSADTQELLGNVDLTEMRFNVYNNTAPAPVDIKDLENALGDRFPNMDRIRVTSAQGSPAVRSGNKAA